MKYYENACQKVKSGKFFSSSILTPKIFSPDFSRLQIDQIFPILFQTLQKPECKELGGICTSRQKQQRASACNFAKPYCNVCAAPTTNLLDQKSSKKRSHVNNAELVAAVFLLPDHVRPMIQGLPMTSCVWFGV